MACNSDLRRSGTLEDSGTRTDSETLPKTRTGTTFSRVLKDSMARTRSGMLSRERVLTETRVDSGTQTDLESLREPANIQTVSRPVWGTLGHARAMAGSRELTGTQTLAETLETVWTCAERLGGMLTGARNRTHL